MRLTFIYLPLIYKYDSDCLSDLAIYVWLRFINVDLIYKSRPDMYTTTRFINVGLIYISDKYGLIYKCEHFA